MRWACLLLAALVSGAAGLHAAESPPGVDPVTKQAPCSIPAMRTDQRPNDGQGPTKVSVGVWLVDITAINDINQTLTAEIAVRQRWRDPRLASLAGCAVPLTSIWTPELIFVNAQSVALMIQRKEVDVKNAGDVTLLQVYSVTVSTYHNLRKFPFDQQAFQIWMFPVWYAEDELEIELDASFTGRRQLLNINDWTVGQVTGSTESHLVKSEQTVHSVFQLNIPAERIASFYVWKVFLPLCMIVAMSWCVFWINPANFGPQIGLSVTSMLTLIAFMFATTNMVPRLGYFTTLDIFIGGSLTFVFLALLESLVTTNLVARDRQAWARRADQVCRALFPLAFVTFVVVVLLR